MLYLLKKICSKDTSKTFSNILLTRNGKAVATDAYIISEIRTDNKPEKDILILPDIKKKNDYTKHISSANPLEYPLYKELFNFSHKKPIVSITLNPALLKKIIDLTTKTDDEIVLKIYPPTDKSPLLIESKNTRNLIMPMIK